MKLNNKIAVITGGNSGIGLATAHEFKAQGARVIIIGRNADAVAAAAGKINQDTIGITADVSKVADLQRAFAEIREKTGRIDVLFANAGIARFAPIADSDEAFYDMQFDANVKGAFFTTQAALPLLSDGASIIYTSSTVASFGMPNASVYSATKTALNSLARSLAIELAPRKIRVNVVSPGPVSTPIFDKMGMNKEQLDQTASGILSMVPLARFGEASEIAKAVLYLASDDSSYVTGTELRIDGGVATA